MLGFLACIRRNGGPQRLVEESGVISPAEIEQLRKNLITELEAGEELVDWKEHTKLLEKTRH